MWKLLEKWPIEEIFLALLIVYITLFSNYLRLSKPLEKFFYQNKWTIYPLIFLLAFAAIGVSDRYSLWTELVASTIVTAIVYFTTSVRLEDNGEYDLLST